MKSDMIKSKEWWPNLDRCIADGLIRVFSTKKSASEAGKPYGWGAHVLRVERSYERVWMVGRLLFQPAEEAGIEFREMAVPLLRWERDCRGIKFCPVAKFRYRK